MNTRFDPIFSNGPLTGTISGSRGSADGSPALLKVRIRPFTSKGESLFQFVYTLPDRELHKNLSASEAAEETDRLLRDEFTQAVLYASDADWHAVSLGKLKIHKKPSSKTPAPALSHNRKKDALLPESADFLVRLGISSSEGVVLKGKYDKYRQINKYLELVEGFIPTCKDRPLRIIDFGCGKAYLTFALYYYLKEIKHVDCDITGLDLKSDVIAFCSGVAEELGYTRLHFSRGDIAEWNEAGPVDMVVTLHACDTATDAAIAKAVGWNASTIITVPCCQHELYSQIKADNQSPLLRHGILKERVAALITDAARAQLLEAVGYKADVIEFIDMEHTPKNIMIRALKKGPPVQKALEEYQTFVKSWDIQPCLEGLLNNLFLLRQ